MAGLWRVAGGTHRLIRADNPESPALGGVFSLDRFASRKKRTDRRASCPASVIGQPDRPALARGAVRVYAGQGENGRETEDRQASWREAIRQATCAGRNACRTSRAATTSARVVQFHGSPGFKEDFTRGNRKTSPHPAPAQLGSR
jgi:hypothetical protein